MASGARPRGKKRPVKQARIFADKLQLDYRQRDDAAWQYVDRDAEVRVRARVVAALDFLERWTGADSRWTTEASDAVVSVVGSVRYMNAARTISAMLNEWASLVEDGLLQPRASTALAVRDIAADDLMGQVRQLNEDDGWAPAAAIVLAGAALELSLRSAVDQLGIEIRTDRPTIETYSNVLRTAGAIEKRDAKDLATMGGLRNLAAHGVLDDLTREHALLMEQHVNLFLPRLEKLTTESLSVVDAVTEGD